ncbi:heterokaryon incompatibility protein-domain-containing protein [Plectosphaerella plurivora]|uniref:Heterokaryon incompatibility protein-domain-containing protein n=1 Tax=Plectosphaerella plurivora TaxID=936078 RepID=A0A9P8VM57_9PEZI|nr:heterokaryon incompatibility protein-domain-containing protein [Plectosphaerella plurivora]
MNAVDIEVDGRHFSIGRNLHEALVVLRSNEEFCQSWIWVDSICIQQGNDAEKTVQVALMGDIFRQASMVCSWLGTSSSEIDAAMDCISKLGTRAFEAGVLEPNAEDLVHRSGKFWEDYTSQVFAANDIDDEVDDATRLCRALCEFYSNLKLDDLQEQEQIAKGLGSFLSKDYWHRGLYYYPFLRDPDIRADLDSHLEFLATHLPRSAGAYNRGRTLFKTEKGMFGAGRDVIQPGDIVTLIRGVGSPIVLQPLSSETGDERFWFKGDAYVDGIMWGEFLETKPSEKVFHIV